jgi:hypothetical protein
MFTTQHANNAMSLVAEKIGRLIIRGKKMSENDPVAMALAYEIAVTLVSPIIPLT